MAIRQTKKNTRAAAGSRVSFPLYTPTGMYHFSRLLIQQTNNPWVGFPDEDIQLTPEQELAIRLKKNPNLPSATQLAVTIGVASSTITYAQGNARNIQAGTIQLFS